MIFVLSFCVSGTKGYSQFFLCEAYKPIRLPLRTLISPLKAQASNQISQALNQPHIRQMRPKLDHQLVPSGLKKAFPFSFQDFVWVIVFRILRTRWFYRLCKSIVIKTKRNHVFGSWSWPSFVLLLLLIIIIVTIMSLKTLCDNPAYQPQL